MPDFIARLDFSWIYHDNALEGVVLSYHELKAAIDLGLTDVAREVLWYRAPGLAPVIARLLENLPQRRFASAAAAISAALWRRVSTGWRRPFRRFGSSSSSAAPWAPSP